MKPQFEVGKGKVGKGGVVRDAALRQDALDAILAFAREAGLEVGRLDRIADSRRRRQRRISRAAAGERDDRERVSEEAAKLE